VVANGVGGDEPGGPPVFSLQENLISSINTIQIGVAGVPLQEECRAEGVIRNNQQH